MKNLLILLTLFTLNIQAQRGISISVYQDAKLLVVGDNHGNKPGTTDLIFNMDWEGNQFKYYYFSIKTQYEIANLSSGKFSRYTVNGMWNFNKLFIPKLEACIGLGFGVIHRPITEGLASYSFTGELNYPLFKTVKITLKYEVVRRSDLIVIWNETQPFKPNFAVGIKVKITKV